MIDDAGEIGVLEIDAHRQDMRLALDAAREVRPFLAHDSSLPLNSGNLRDRLRRRGEAEMGEGLRASARRPRGVRAMKPCCNR